MTASDDERLRARARALATRPRSGVVAAIAHRGPEVRIGGERFLLPSERVRELRAMPRLTKLPDAPPWLRGIAYVRGELVTVADLGRWFQTITREENAYLAVLSSPRGPLGVGVAEVLGFREVFAGELGPANEQTGRPVVGLTHDGVAVLDVDALVARRELVIG